MSVCPGATWDTHVVTMPEFWTSRHFSLANPRGPGQADLPSLLRRVAETLEEIGSVDVQDLVLHNEVTTDGNWASITVYYEKDRGED